VLLLSAPVRADDPAWTAHIETGTKAQRLAQFADAERAFAAALAEAEKFGERDVRVPTSLIHLADVYLQQGRYGKADDLCLHAQELLEMHHGKMHPELGRCLNVRADIYRRLGLYRTAERLARWSLFVREVALGSEHLDVADSLDTLTRIEIDKRGWAYKAERARKIRAKKLADDHPDALPGLLVWIRSNAGRYPWGEKGAAAEKELRSALTLARKVHGEVHPLTAETLTLLAWVLAYQEKFREAEAAQQQALAIWKKTLGPDHPNVGTGLQGLAVIEHFRGVTLSDADKPFGDCFTRADNLFSESVKYRFACLSDDELCRYFRLAVRERPDMLWPVGGAEMAFEAYLIEMARRGGDTIERCLQTTIRWQRVGHQVQLLYGELRSFALSLPLRIADQLPYPDTSLPNLEILTARRRAQRKPDPVQVLVPGPAERECVFPEVPVFCPLLKNLDPDGHAVGDTVLGGNLPQPWCIHVHDARGYRLPVEPGGEGNAGGFFTGSVSRQILLPDEWRDAKLRLRKFVRIDEPGEYTVHILYHDSSILAGADALLDLGSLAGVITCRSRPIKLKVKPRVIELSKEEQETVRKWLAKLDDTERVKVVHGPYGKWAHGFVDPQSPHGHLLALGWKAVPALLDELADKRLTTQRRAWILAVLFSITRVEELSELRSDYLFGVHDSLYEPRPVEAGEKNEPFSSTKAKIHEGDQRASAERWLRWRKFIIVKDRRAAQVGERKLRSLTQTA
jgi:tetratricopeptide (TPR) repeat protein